jgi:predicted AAA+ superfamily ATPase
MNSMAIDTGVDNKTISSWLSVLENSFVLFRLQPHHKNFNKRIVKMPKLFFYDTGLASSLLGFQNKEQLRLSPYYGAMFENLVVSDLMKYRLNRAENPNLYFWRDNTGNEIDIILEKPEGLYPVEIKSGKTITNEFFKGLNRWSKISGQEKGSVIYAGDEIQHRSNGISVLPWNQYQRVF